MRNQIKHVNYNDLEIIVFVDGEVTERHSFYYPAHILLFLKKGTLILELPEGIKEVGAGYFTLINRHTHGMMSKSWTAEENGAEVYAIALHQKFIHKVIQKVPAKLKEQTTTAPESGILVMPPNPILKGLFGSLSGYIEEGQVDSDLVELKTLEAILGILKFHPAYYEWFLKNEEDHKADIRLLVENNYMFNLPIERFAELSGRSLSTFRREFKTIFKETPHRWLLRRPLQRAKEILLNSDQKPVDIYLTLGFESLAHFSRTFKDEFGITLTNFRKNKI